MPPITVGTRGSALARTQTGWVVDRLRAAYPDVAFSIEIISTDPDRRPETPLRVFGDKAAFVVELERALLDGRVDVAVHSLKDMPSVLPEGLALAAVPEREDPRDALVLPQGSTDVNLADLPIGAILGSSSLRRTAQLRALRPDLEVREIRGNVDTRLLKLDTGEYAALALACAGLNRLRLCQRITRRFPPEEVVPAIGQGALGIECREDDTATRDLVAAINHGESWRAVTAERALARALDVGCRVPIGALAETTADETRLRAVVATDDGSLVRAEDRGVAGDEEGLGNRVAERLRAIAGPTRHFSGADNQASA